MLQNLITKNLKKKFSGINLNSNFSTEVKLSIFCWFIGNLLFSRAFGTKFRKNVLFPYVGKQMNFESLGRSCQKISVSQTNTDFVPEN